MTVEKTYKSFEDLDAWKRCREFRCFVAQAVTPLLANRKEFGLLDQLRRSARSTTANIAEGYGRFHYNDNYRFCSIARGSLYESLDHMITASDEKLIDSETLTTARQLFAEAVACLNGYMKFLQSSAN